MVTVQNFYGLIAAVGVCGIAQALANPVTNLLIAQQVPPEKKAMVVGLKQAGVQLSALFAGLVLPGIAIATSWRFALGIIIPLSFIFIITTPFITPKKHTGTGKGFKLSLPNPLLFRLMSIQFCVGISLSAFVTFLPTFATQQGMPLSLAGTLIAVFGAMGIISRMVLTPMGAKLKDESLLLLALIAIAAIAMAITIQASPEQYWPLWVGAVGVGLTAVGTNAIAMSMLIRDSAFGAVTFASGFVSVAFFGGFALGPPLYGVLSDYSGGVLLSWVTLISVLVAGCVMALSLAAARRRNLQPRDENLLEIAQLKSEVLLLNERLSTLESNYVAVLIKLNELSGSHKLTNETISADSNDLHFEQIGSRVSDLKSNNPALQKNERKKQRKKPQVYRVN
jgi:MFS family permease